MDQPKYKLPSFRHSGKLGDAVYSLASVRTFGLANFYIGYGAHIPRDAAEQLLPLLNAQSYIKRAELWEGQNYDYDLDQFRIYGLEHNLADAHLICFGLDPRYRDKAWLEVDEIIDEESPRVIFARSLQYRGVPDFWNELYGRFGDQAVFIGNADEHYQFESEIGTISFTPTKDLLEAARLIAKSKLFVGNQSCLLAIAEGLKCTLVQEVSNEIPNCIFYRNNSYPIMSAKQLSILLNELDLRSITGKPHIQR